MGLAFLGCHDKLFNGRLLAANCNVPFSLPIFEFNDGERGRGRLASATRHLTRRLFFFFFQFVTRPFVFFHFTSCLIVLSSRIPGSTRSNDHTATKSESAVQRVAGSVHLFIQSPLARLSPSAATTCVCGGFSTQASSCIACVTIVAETCPAMEFQRRDGVAHPTTHRVIVPTRHCYCCRSGEEGQDTETRSEAGCGGRANGAARQEAEEEVVE